jgi:hypothetical protein
MEEKIDTFRKAALREVTKELLEESQRDFQKSLYATNGSYRVKIKTIHGSFAFRVLRLLKE